MLVNGVIILTLVWDLMRRVIFKHDHDKRDDRNQFISNRLNVSLELNRVITYTKATIIWTPQQS